MLSEFLINHYLVVDSLCLFDRLDQYLLQGKELRNLIQPNKRSMNN